MTPTDINMVKHCQWLRLLPMDLRKDIVIASNKIIVNTID